MFTKTILAATLASIAVAAPVEQRQESNGAFTMITTHSGNQQVHLRGVEANGHRFWIGKDTATFCPEVENLDCSKTGKYTSVVAQANTPTALGMNVIVPGGQQAYVTADGQIGYTTAHSSSSPEGSVRIPFIYTPQTENTNGNLKFNGLDFAACPSDTDFAYQIYAVGAPAFVRTDCISVSILTFNNNNPTPAWQFE